MCAARRRHVIAHDGLATGGSVALIFDEEHILDQVARARGVIVHQLSSGKHVLEPENVQPRYAQGQSSRGIQYRL